MTGGLSLRAMMTMPTLHTNRSTSHRTKGRLPRYRESKCFVDITSIPPVCFTKECQTIADQTSLVVIGIPICVAALWVAYLLRPIPKSLLENDKVFEDPATGVVFQGDDGRRPERDAKGELVFKAIGFTPWPISSDERGERIRIDVGPIQKLEPRTYVFSKILKFPSKLLVCSLSRPLGIAFSQNREQNSIVVEEILPDSAAEQQQKIAQLNDASRMNAPMKGDVVRGLTCTNFVYPTAALLGMNLPEKHIVVFGADGQPWKKFRNALNSALDEDANVTIILERSL